LPPTDKVVGMDAGLTHFATLSNGDQIDNPRFFRKDENALAKAQRRLSQETKGTPPYLKRKRVINHIHQRIANRRRDFAHKASRQLVNEYQLVAFENLDIIDMKAPRGHPNHRGMNKSIGDIAWYQFVQFTTSKIAQPSCLRMAICGPATPSSCAPVSL
jgi:putative transposase